MSLGYLDFFVSVVEFKLLYVCFLFIRNNNFGLFYVQFQHGTIIRTRITYKKITCCYMRDSACRWLIVENAKTF